jgi:hypothetical protein
MAQTATGAVARVVGIRRRGLREIEVIGSCSQVNLLIAWFGRERLPAVDFAHGDLTRRHERPEQHGRGIGRGQHGLGLDPPLELLMQALDRIGCSGALPLAWRQAGEREEALARLLQAVGERRGGEASTCE